MTDATLPGSSGPLIPWLDGATDALVRDVTATLVAGFPDLLAVVLYGSVARHGERPLDAPCPSDVDLLAVFDTDDALVTAHRGLAFSVALGPAYMRHLDAPREVQLMLASRGLSEWDPAFVANVARDGCALYARGPLPAPLAYLPMQRLDDGHSVTTLTSRPGT